MFIVSYKDQRAYEQAYPNDAEESKGQVMTESQIYTKVKEFDTMDQVKEFMNNHIEQDVFRHGANMGIVGSSMVYKLII
jgi:hypothetical protein